MPEGVKTNQPPVYSTNNPVNNSTKTPPISSEEELKTYLDKDTTYQNYRHRLHKMEERMSQLESKYGISRSISLAGGMTFGTREWDSQFNEFNMDDKDQNEYSNLKLLYNSLSRDLGQYETQMKEWVDGPLGEKSLYKHNSVQYTNLERITLADGRKAWKTNQGTFFPAPNGMPGGPAVPKELLN